MKTFNKILSLIAVGSMAAAYASDVTGSASGVFVNPTGPGGMVVTGVGTNSFTWGAGSDRSNLTVTGSPFSADFEQVFVMGSLNYYNGTIPLGTEATGVDLDVNLTLTTPVGGENFLFNLGINNTPNVGTPEENADYVTLASSFSPTTFNVGGVDYTLEFVGFGSVSGSGFVTTIDQFHVLEDASASTQLLGRITANTQAVPEPTSFILLGAGLLAVAFVARKRRAA